MELTLPGVLGLGLGASLFDYIEGIVLILVPTFGGVLPWPGLFGFKTRFVKTRSLLLFAWFAFDDPS